MDKTILYILFFFAFGISERISGQVNLVPNPGFEIINSCESDSLGGGIFINNAPPWNSPSDGSPDIYNSCCTYNIGSVYLWGVPSNYFGWQPAHNGNGYAGAAIYGKSTNYDYREYMQVELDSMLVNQQNYCVSFYVSFANYWKIASNNIGMYFSNSDTTILNLGFPAYQGTLNVMPQINDTNIVTDSTNWTLISGTYTSHGGEKYIIIGNFYSDSLTDTVHNMNGTVLGPPGGYYYIDDVDVHCCSCNHEAVSEIEKESIEIYPNPATTKLTLNLKTYEGNISLYNIIGEIVFTSAITNPQTEIDLSTMPKGMYFVEVRAENKIGRKKFVKE